MIAALVTITITATVVVTQQDHNYRINKLSQLQDGTFLKPQKSRHYFDELNKMKTYTAHKTVH